MNDFKLREFLSRLYFKVTFTVKDKKSGRNMRKLLFIGGGTASEIDSSFDR